MLRSGVLALGESLIHVSKSFQEIMLNFSDVKVIKVLDVALSVANTDDTEIQRGFMALADVEGANIHLKELILSHQLASWESIQEILIRHYSRQSLHEMYKVISKWCLCIS